MANSITPAKAMSLAAPSKRQILEATAIALVVAFAIWLAFVLPAETGKDPLHTGALFGLTSLSKAGATVVSTSGVEAFNPAAVSGGEGKAPVIQGVFVPEPGAYKVDSRELKLGPGEGIEIKYHLQRGASMVYSWTASDVVGYEFHGEPDVKPAGAGADYYESYDNDIRKGKKQSSGAFTAPSTGIHGWFWDNTSDGPVTIQLRTAGFYDYIWQNKDDVKTKLQPSDPQ